MFPLFSFLVAALAILEGNVRRHTELEEQFDTEDSDMVQVTGNQLEYR